MRPELRYTIHLLSFAFQDVLLTFLVVEPWVSSAHVGWNLGQVNEFAIAAISGTIITTLSLLIVWFCQDAETYESSNPTELFLYSRMACALPVVIFGVLSLSTTLPQAAVVLLSVTLFALTVLTIADTAALVIRSFFAT